MSYVGAPYYAKGPGVLVYFEGGGKHYENIPFKHHLTLGTTGLAINGCVMAQWAQGDPYTCQVNVRGASPGDSMDTSSD
jgi:hypothetical protein